jgi:hypothetical protein
MQAFPKRHFWESLSVLNLIESGTRRIGIGFPFQSSPNQGGLPDASLLMVYFIFPVPGGCKANRGFPLSRDSYINDNRGCSKTEVLEQQPLKNAVLSDF